MLRASHEQGLQTIGSLVGSWEEQDIVDDKAHRQYTKQLNANKNLGVAEGVQNFDPILVRNVIDDLRQVMTTRDIGKLIGVDERRVRDIYCVNRTVSADLLERVYIAAGRVDELNNLLPTYGTPEWSDKGECCLDCGTYWRKHYENGLCYRCHGNLQQRDTVVA